MFTVIYDAMSGRAVLVRDNGNGSTTSGNPEGRLLAEYQTAVRDGLQGPLDLSDKPPPVLPTPRQDAAILADLEVAIGDGPTFRQIVKRLAFAAIKEHRSILKGLVEGET